MTEFIDITINVPQECVTEDKVSSHFLNSEGEYIFVPHGAYRIESEDIRPYILKTAGIEEKHCVDINIVA